MKLIIILCLLLLVSCQNDVPQTSQEPTSSPTLETSISSQETNTSTDEIFNLVSNNNDIIVEQDVQPIDIVNPTMADIENVITIYPLTEPYYRIARTYTINDVLTYEKNNESRTASLIIHNYRNDPTQYASNVYECYLGVPQSDDATSYHFFGVTYDKDIFVFKEDGKTESLYFTTSLQNAIINSLLNAEEEINKLDEQNLEFAYKHIIEENNIDYLINRTYYEHSACTPKTSDYLYIKDMDIDFFKQISPTMETDVYYDGNTGMGGYYNRMYANNIFTIHDEQENILSIIVLDSEIICQAGGGNRGNVYIIDLNNKKLLSYDEIINKYNLNKDKINEFIQTNDIITYNDMNYGLYENSDNHIFVHNNKLCFLAYQAVEHGSTCPISYPIENFQ